MYRNYTPLGWLCQSFGLQFQCYLTVNDYLITSKEGAKEPNAVMPGIMSTVYISISKIKRRHDRSLQNNTQHL